MKNIILTFTIFCLSIISVFSNNYKGSRKASFWYDMISNLDNNERIISLTKLKYLEKLYKNDAKLYDKSIHYIKAMLLKKHTKQKIKELKLSIIKDEELKDYALIELSKYYYKKKQYNKAFSYANDIVENFQNSLVFDDAALYCAKIKYLQRKKSNCGKYLSKIKSKETDPKFASESAKLYYKIGWYNKALYYFKRVIKLNHNNVYKDNAYKNMQILVFKKMNLKKQKKVDNAVFLIKNYLEANQLNNAYYILTKVPYSAERNFYLGLVYYKKGKLELSTKYFKIVIANYKKSKYLSESIFYRAKANIEAGHKKLGVKSLINFIKKYPYDDYTDNAYFTLAEYYFDNNKKSNALNLLKKIRLSYPNNDKYYDALWEEANYYKKTKEYGKSIDILTTLVNMLQNKDEFIKALYWRGKTFEKEESFLDAAQDYLEIISKAPMSYYAYRATVKIKSLYKKIDDFTRKIEFKYCSNKSSYRDVLSKIEEHLTKKTEFSYISGYTREFTQFNYKDVELEIFPNKIYKDHFYKYYVLKSLKKYDYAIKELEYVMEVKGDELRYIYNMSHLLTESKNVKKAIDIVEDMINKYPDKFSISSMPKNLKKILYPRYYSDMITYNSYRQGVDPCLIYAIIREESRFREMAHSRVGARGLMQIMPGTGRWISKQLKLRYYRTYDLYIPTINIKMGTWYFSYLNKMNNNNFILSLASYNGGYNNVNNWIKKYKVKDIDAFVEKIPFRETKRYIKKVMRSYNIYKQIYGKGYDLKLTSNQDFFTNDDIKY